MVMVSRQMRASEPAVLEGKVALVTGATRGIGREIAVQLADAGTFVYGIGRDQKALADLQQRLGSKGKAVAADILEQNEIGRALESIRKEHGRIDFLINNAGMAHTNMPVEQLPFATFRKVVETNLFGVFLMTQAALPLMQAGGVIVNNLSVAAQRVFPGASGYCSSKFGALGFTSTLREELRERKIRVTGLIPGPIATDIWNQFWADAPRERMAQAQDVAHVVLDILRLQAGATVEFVHVGPTGGEL
jgi:NAD(P)-dependent dehydrogenase (short-subunit alcohol dehydrogenase family)